MPDALTVTSCRVSADARLARAAARRDNSHPGPPATLTAHAPMGPSEVTRHAPQRYVIVLYDARPIRRLLAFLRRNRVRIHAIAFMVEVEDPRILGGAAQPAEKGRIVVRRTVV